MTAPELVPPPAASGATAATEKSRCIQDTSRCGRILTEYLLNAGTRPQTSERARKSPCNREGQKKKQERNETGPVPQGGSCERGKVLRAGKSPHQQGDRPGRRGSLRASERNTVWSVALSTARPAQTVSATALHSRERAWGEDRARGAAVWCGHTRWALRKKPELPTGTTVGGARGGEAPPSQPFFLREGAGGGTSSGSGSGHSPPPAPNPHVLPPLPSQSFWAAGGPPLPLKNPLPGTGHRICTPPASRGHPAHADQRANRHTLRTAPTGLPCWSSS